MTTFFTSREISATPDEIFAAISTPDRLARWWGPAGFTNTFSLCEFKAGGRWAFVMHGPDGANYANENRFTEIEATIAATLRFPSGGLAQFVASFGAAACDSYRVVGTLGDLELDPGFKFEAAMQLRVRKDGKEEELAFPQVDHFAGQLTYFSDCIEASTPPEADGEEGLADLRALLAIEESALTGKPVAISSPSRFRHPTPDMERQRPVTKKRLLV